VLLEADLGVLVEVPAEIDDVIEDRFAGEWGGRVLVITGSPRTHSEPLLDPLRGSSRGSSEFVG
jgi:hypothetical protein